MLFVKKRLKHRIHQAEACELQAKTAGFCNGRNHFASKRWNLFWQI